MRSKHTYVLASAVLGAFTAAAPSARAALTFSNTISNGGNANFNTAVAQAEALWQGVFSDNVTLNLTFNFVSGATYLANTSSTLSAPLYSTYRMRLGNDATSATDAQAISSLPSTGPLTFTTRKGGATVLDSDGSNNNNYLAITNANAKAVGLPATGNDATINTSSTSAPYDFNRADGIDPNQYDIVGILAHEIGHAMGFVSFTDNLDGGGNSDDTFAELRPLDLFRRKSSGSGGGIDVTVAGDPYLSLDNGATRVGNLSSGQVEGDKFQASHWENRGPQDPFVNAGPVIGIMDPQIANGELASITSADIAAFDAIGWTVQVPEPTTLAALTLGSLTLAARRRRA